MELGNEFLHRIRQNQLAAIGNNITAVAVIGLAIEAIEAIKKIASSDCARPKPRRTEVVPLFTANVAAVNLPASIWA